MSMPKVRDSPYSVDTTPTRVTTIDPYFQFKELTRVYKVEKTFKQTRGNLIQIETVHREPLPCMPSSTTDLTR